MLRLLKKLILRRIKMLLIFFFSVSEAISEEAGVRTASSGDASPEVTSGIMSRQAHIRQPVKLRKRRLQ